MTSALVGSAAQGFSTDLGEQPRLLVAKLGQDGHDRGAKVIASVFGDVGFNVIAGPLFQTPEEAVDLAIRSKAHVVGMSSLAAAHKTLGPQLVEALKARGAKDVVAVIGASLPVRTASITTTMALRPFSARHSCARCSSDHT